MGGRAGPGGRARLDRPVRVRVRPRPPLPCGSRSDGHPSPHSGGCGGACQALAVLLASPLSALPAATYLVHLSAHRKGWCPTPSTRVLTARLQRFNIPFEGVSGPSPQLTTGWVLPPLPPCPPLRSNTLRSAIITNYPPVKTS